MTRQITFLNEEPPDVNPARADLVAQERAALVTARLCTRGQISLKEVLDLTGLTYSGAWYVMSKIARVVACYYDRDERSWKVV